MGPATYIGPGALGMSMYASPRSSQAALATMPPAVSSYDSTIATEQQIADASDSNANGIALRNADAQLAIAQGHALKTEVDKHAAKLSSKVSTAVANTHQLLALINDSLQKEGVTDTGTVNKLWTELEQLITAAGDANTTIPLFLKKQRNNMSLYHASAINESMRDTQEELNIQHKKVNLQHALILEHQEAFHEYREQNAAKLKELDECRERVSRLTLEKGNFRTEIERYKTLLDQKQTDKDEVLSKVDALEKELNTLVTSKAALLAEADGLRNAVQDRQTKLQQVEQQVTDKFKAELMLKAGEVAKEAEKNMDLKSLIDLQKANAEIAQARADKLMKENGALNEKYRLLAAEHAHAFSKLNGQTKRIDSLVMDLEQRQKENVDLKQQFSKLSELEKQHANFSQAKPAFPEEMKKLSAELEKARDDGLRAKTDIDQLMKKVIEFEKTTGRLETEKNDRLAQQIDAEKAAQALQIQKLENLRLKEVIRELQNGSITGDPQMCVQENTQLLEKVRGLEAKSAALETALEEWTHLAKRSYKEYKEMLPLYKLADQCQKESLSKDGTIKDLKDQLSAAKASQYNGGDTGYWKGKYESLLATIGG